MDIQYLLAETLKPYDKVEISISQDDYDRLKADIQANGIKTPLHVHKHTVLAGANRLKVAQEIGIKFVPCILLPDDMTELEMREYAILDNLARRHMTTEQKAALALELEKIEAEKAQKRQISELKQNQIKINQNPSDISDSDITVEDSSVMSSDSDITNENGDTEKGAALKLAAQKAGISYDTAFKAKTLATKAPEAWQEVQAGKKTIHRAYVDYRQQNMGLRTPDAQCMIDIQDLQKHMNRIYDLKLLEIQTVSERILKNYQHLSEEDKKQLLEIFTDFNKVVKTMETLVELQKILVEYAE